MVRATRSHSFLRHAIFRQPYQAVKSAESGRWILLARRSPRPTVLTGPTHRARRTTCLSIYQPEIWIGGNIRKALSPIFAPPSPPRALPSNGARERFAPKTVQDLKTSLRQNDQGEWLLWLCDDQASWGQFEGLDGFCGNTVLPTRAASEGPLRYDPELVEYRPGSGGSVADDRCGWLPAVRAKDLTPSRICWTRPSNWVKKMPAPRLLSADADGAENCSASN